jgi:hypothetical protein
VEQRINIVTFIYLLFFSEEIKYVFQIFLERDTIDNRLRRDKVIIPSYVANALKPFPNVVEAESGQVTNDRTICVSFVAMVNEFLTLLNLWSICLYLPSISL